MASECRFILANGRKCRGAAIRHHDFCRHHAPQPVPAGPPPLSQRNRFTALKKWRSLGRSLAWLHPAEVPFAIYEILDSLTGRDPNNRLSDNVAGRYLRALLSQLRQVPFPRPPFPSAAQPPVAASAPVQRAQPHAAQPHAAQPHVVQPRPAAPAAGLSPELRAAAEAFLANPSLDESLDALLDAFTKAGFPPPPLASGLPRSSRV